MPTTPTPPGPLFPRHDQDAFGGPHSGPFFYLIVGGGNAVEIDRAEKGRQFGFLDAGIVAHGIRAAAAIWAEAMKGAV